MSRKKKILFGISIAVLLPLIPVVLLTFLLRASLPAREGSVELAGISSPVRILFDNKGIPQIWAEKERDAWFAVGWLHASDRLFQMEMVRRVATGRLSEWFGEQTLEYDREQRLIDHQKIARQGKDLLKNEYISFLQAYVDGINAWANQIPVLPFEFYLLGSKFEPWKIDDVLVLFSFQTWFSNILQHNDPFYLLLEKNMGREAASGFIAPYPDEAPPTVPAENKSDQNKQDRLEAGESWPARFIGSVMAAKASPFSLAKASNAWAVSPGKSRSGSAILANDPHLDLSRLPQFWYVLGIHTRDGKLDAAGISTPGIPAIVMGYNRQIAWAFTAGGVDISDEYIEKLNAENPDQYLYKGQYINFASRLEYIQVKGRSTPDTLRVRTTIHGPVTGTGQDSSEVYTVHWAGYDFHPAGAVASGFELVKTSGFESFRRIVTNFAALDANWIYADHEGNIGYQLGTPLPVRSFQNSNLRLPGCDERYNWQGYYPLEQTPFAYNPRQGWLASCNNKPSETTGEYPLPGNFADGRIRQITALLSQDKRFSADDMMAFQLDVRSRVLPLWKNELSRLLEQLGEDVWVDEIRSWTGECGTASKAAALLHTWLALLTKYTFADEFPEQLNSFMNPTVNRGRNLFYLYFGNNHAYFDDKSTAVQRETKEDIALRALRDALHFVGEKTWGEIQTLTMAHPMAGIPILSTLLGLKKGPFARPGTQSSLNNSTAFWQDEGFFKSLGGPSWRFVHDFGERDNAWIVLPAGQSGHPLSPHFFDLYDEWEEGVYWTLPLDREKIEVLAASELILHPRAVKVE